MSGLHRIDQLDLTLTIVTMIYSQTPQLTPHSASPTARTESDGAKIGMKTMTPIQHMKNIIVKRQLKHGQLSS